MHSLCMTQTKLTFYFSPHPTPFSGIVKRFWQWLFLRVKDPALFTLAVTCFFMVASRKKMLPVTKDTTRSQSCSASSLCPPRKLHSHSPSSPPANCSIYCSPQYNTKCILSCIKTLRSKHLPFSSTMFRALSCFITPSPPVSREEHSSWQRKTPKLESMDDQLAFSQACSHPHFIILPSNPHRHKSDN